MFLYLQCLRGFSKKSVLYLPPIGLNLKFSGSIFVNKSIDKDKKNIEESINYFTNYPNSSWVKSASDICIKYKQFFYLSYTTAVNTTPGRNEIFEKQT